MVAGRLDQVLSVLVGCERFRPALYATLAGEGPGLALRFDHYAVRRRKAAFPDLAEPERREPYPGRFLDAALERMRLLAQDLLTAGLPSDAEPADPALACIAGPGEPATGLVEVALDRAATVLAETIAANLTTARNRLLTLALPRGAEAVEVTLDPDVVNGWGDGKLRLTLTGAEKARWDVMLDAAPDLPAPFRCEVLPPEAATGRPRLRIGWPRDARPRALRLSQRGGWPSPQAQARFVAVGDGLRRDLNPVKTALDLLALIGQISREDRARHGRNLPMACIGWQYLMKNDLGELRSLQKALGFADADHADLLAAVPLHNRGLPPALRRVVGRGRFAKPLDRSESDAIGEQVETVATLFEGAFGRRPFLTHATLMACQRDGRLFDGEETVSLAVLVEAQDAAAMTAAAARAVEGFDDRLRVSTVAKEGLTASLVCRLAGETEAVPVEVLLFWRDGAGRVHGIGESAHALAFENDWFETFDEVSFHGRPMRVPREWRAYLADVTASRWTVLGQSYGALSSIRAAVEAFRADVLRPARGAGAASSAPSARSRLREALSGMRATLLHPMRSAARKAEPDMHEGGPGLRVAGLRDLVGDPGIGVTILAQGRPYTRPAADLVVDLSDRAYRHDLAAPMRMPLSPVAMVEAPAGTTARGTVLAALPDGRLLMPRHARHDSALVFADVINRAQDFDLPQTEFFTGLVRAGEDGFALRPQPVRDIPGDVFWASPDEYDNWGMWLVQTLPAIMHAEATGFDGTLLCWAWTGWQRRFIETCAPRLARRLVVQEPGFAYRAGGRLSMVAQDTRTMAQTAFQRATYESLVERALREVPPVAGEERIFVSRRSHSQANPAYRGLVNEPDLIEALGRHGFACVEPERRSVLEQVALFARAREIVGLGGAGMFNLQFAQAGASVLDIESSPGWVASHTNIFATSNLRFGVIFGQPVEQAGAHSRWSVPIGRAMPHVRQFFGLDAG